MRPSSPPWASVRPRAVLLTLVLLLPTLALAGAFAGARGVAAQEPAAPTTGPETPPGEPANEGETPAEASPGGDDPGADAPAEAPSGDAAAQDAELGPRPEAGFPAIAASPGADLFPEPVHETLLEAVFDPEERTVDGRERLRWRNTSGVAVTELQFHHYLNAFSSNASTFMRGSGGEMRGAEFGDDGGWGWIEVESLRLADGTDLKAVEEFVQPEDGDPGDRTVARYPLPRPLAPGAWLELDIEFTSRFPTPPFARTGMFGDYVLAGQWFPKIAVFEDAGVRGRERAGWNAHQFHPSSEFYADFGSYDATLDLPARYAGKVGATGRMVEEREEGERYVVRFQQDGVHDFAWTGDPDFVVVEDRFDPEADVPADFRRHWSQVLGVPESELALTAVDVTLLLQPANATQERRYLDATKVAIRGYGTRLGAYPYDTLTVVDPPLGALGSGGMEYPTFITVGTHPLLQVPGFRRLLAPESVTVHEFGHQYFQGMIASNEFEESWIDEGINTYYENEVMPDAYGRAGLSFLGAEIPYEEGIRNGLDGGQYRDPMVTPAWGYYSGGSYGLNSYDRPGLTLNHLEGILGAERFARAMRDFFQRYRFTHPSSADFEASIQQSTGEDLGWFFQQAFHSTRSLDYGVRQLSSRRVAEPRGVFWRDGERTEVTRDSDDGDDDDGDGDGDRDWRSVATVFRYGDFVHPVTVEITFAGGHKVRRQWDGDTRWARWTFTGSRRVVSAEVDPDHTWSLDTNRLNDSYTDEPDSAPVTGITADLLYWFQLLMSATGLVG